MTYDYYIIEEGIMQEMSSFYGDMIVDEYDEQNNPINPPSPVGFLFYILLGYGFDRMSEMCTQFMNDFDILTANTKGLDNFWGVGYNMQRPRLPYSERLLTDDEYKIYLYLRNCRLMTREDIEISMNKCFARVDEDKMYTIYFSEEMFGLDATDHVNYDSLVTESSNLGKNAQDSTTNFVTDFSNDEDTMRILGNLSTTEEKVTVINIPFKKDIAGWDSEFLEFMEQYISVKGDLKIKEYPV